MARITFDLTEQDDAYVLDENLLLEFTKKIWSASRWGKFKLIFKLRKMSVAYMNTKRKLDDYRNGYILPVVFINNGIPVSRITHEIVDLT